MFVQSWGRGVKIRTLIRADSVDLVNLCNLNLQGFTERPSLDEFWPILLALDFYKYVQVSCEFRLFH